jgi:hypothetical protein
MPEHAGVDDRHTPWIDIDACLARKGRFHHEDAENRESRPRVPHDREQPEVLHQTLVGIHL